MIKYNYGFVWVKSSELAPVLTSKGAALKGKVCRACIQSVLGCASETWAMKVKEMARLERTERWSGGCVVFN